MKEEKKRNEILNIMKFTLNLTEMESIDRESQQNITIRVGWCFHLKGQCARLAAPFRERKKARSPRSEIVSRVD